MFPDREQSCQGTMLGNTRFQQLLPSQHLLHKVQILEDSSRFPGLPLFWERMRKAGLFDAHGGCRHRSYCSTKITQQKISQFPKEILGICVLQKGEVGSKLPKILNTHAHNYLLQQCVFTFDLSYVYSHCVYTEIYSILNSILHSQCFMNPSQSKFYRCDVGLKGHETLL